MPEITILSKPIKVHENDNIVKNESDIDKIDIYPEQYEIQYNIDLTKDIISLSETISSQFTEEEAYPIVFSNKLYVIFSFEPSQEYIDTLNTIVSPFLLIQE